MPEEVIGRLLASVRGQFCGDFSDKEWFKHVRFVRVKVLLWPAAFMAGKGFTLSVQRYEQILRSILLEVKRHATTAPVRYWPGYLMKCVQDHFKHHWEEYYQEAKSARSLAENVLLAARTVRSEDRGVEALALAHKVLTSQRRSMRVAKPGKQLNLFA